MISLTDLRKVYAHGGRTTVALDGVTLEVAAGDIFGVLGASGAGKSTLIRCVNLLERPTSGSVVVNGQELTSLTAAALRHARQQIGMIFQQFNVLSSRTVAENVAFPLEIMGRARSDRERRVRELLALVGLSDKADAYPAQLSGGQKQRVGIARALASEPRVLLSDEATSALDPQTTTAILDLLRDLNRRLDLTILLITHEMSVVKQICDHVAVLDTGRVVEQGTVAQLVAQPQSRLAQALFPPRSDVVARPGVTSATVTFVGSAADQPVLATLVRRFDIDVNILGGVIERVGVQRVGQLQIELSGTSAATGAALAHLRGLGLHVETH